MTDDSKPRPMRPERIAALFPEPGHELGSNLDRERAVAQLGRDLARHEPAAPLDASDFFALIPAVDASAPTREEHDRRRIEAERERRLIAAGVATALTADDLEWLIRDELPLDTDSLRTVRRWDHARSTGTSAFSVLVMLGLRGVGKSVAAGWLLAKHGPGIYCSAEMLRASFKATNAQDRDLYRRAQRTRVLVVDELGRESDAESADAMMFDVINGRRGRAGGRDQLWTMLLGNISEKDFRERYDPSTVDRIEQQGAILRARGSNLRERLVDKMRAAKRVEEPKP